MKYLAPFLVVISLVKFTDTTGSPVAVNPASVVAVGSPIGCMDVSARARINFGSAQFQCIREDLATAVERLTTGHIE